MTIITPLLLLALMLLLVPPAFFAADIQQSGFRAWFREGLKQPGLKWFGWYFPRGLKTMGPILYVGLIASCLYVVHWLRQ